MLCQAKGDMPGFCLRKTIYLNSRELNEGFYNSGSNVGSLTRSECELACTPLISSPYLNEYPGGSYCKESAYNAGDPWGSIPGSGCSPGGQHGNPLQYSCLWKPQGVEKGLSFFTLYTHILFEWFKVLNNQVLWQRIFTKISHSPNKYPCVYCMPGIKLEAGNTAGNGRQGARIHTPHHIPGQILMK